MIKIPQLFQINADKTTPEIMTKVPIKSGLKTDECYIIIADDTRRVYLWKGQNCNVRSRFMGAKLAQKVRDQIGKSYRIISVEEGEEDIYFFKNFGGLTQAEAIKKSKADKFSKNKIYPLREKSLFGSPSSIGDLDIIGSTVPRSSNFNPLYQSKGSTDLLLEDFETQIPLNLIKELQEKVNNQQIIINKLKKEFEVENIGVETTISKIPLSNKERILNLLKSKGLTSRQIAEKLKLSKQDTRTYLLRLKKENKIKTLGKKGRYYIYTAKMPLNTTGLSLKDEISKKIFELEAKLKTITSKPNKSLEDEFL